MLKYLAVVSSLLIFVEAQQRWHASQINLIKLYELQNDHFNAFNKYLDLETIRLEELKNYVAAVYERHDHKVTKEDHLHSHLDAIKVIKQMHHKHCKVRDLKKNDKSIEDLSEIDERNDLSDQHILWAYQAMRRIQIFYAIPASDMSAGRMNDKIIGDRMDACDCFVMAKYCFEENDMYGVIDWAVEAYGKWQNDGQPQCVDPIVLNFYIVSSSVYTGFNFMNLIKPSESNYHEDTEKFTRYYHLMKNELFEMVKQSGLNIFEVHYHLVPKSHQDFRRMCNDGHVSRTLTEHSKCRYQTKNSFYRILMPFKEEDINSDPLIKIYHDVIYDNEISKIKAKAMENMKDAEVLTSKTDYKFQEKSRSGQVCKIDGDEHLDLLNFRIESFTEFSTKTAEQYQIVNYGLGGHYFPHYDTFNKGLTDVQNDGYTSFPRLDVISPAEKGAALVWHNLILSNGERNHGTLHGSCPLLKGNKWIMTRWLYEDGQHLLYDWKNK